MDWMIYGANGYTGELIAREAKKRGANPVLAGRDATKIAKLATDLSLPSKVFSLDKPPDIAAALDGTGLVLNCAGPFSKTADPLMQACLIARTHYLDITGEIDVLEGAHRLDADAKSADVVLCPGVGFDVTPTDCIARMLKTALPEAHELALGFEAEQRMSPGTAKTAIEALGKSGKIRRNGRIINLTIGRGCRKIDFGRGPKLAMPIPWGDVATAFHTTGIPNITVFTPISSSLLALARLMNAFGFILRSRHVQTWLVGRSEGPQRKKQGDPHRQREWLFPDRLQLFGHRRAIDREWICSGLLDAGHDHGRGFHFQPARNDDVGIAGLNRSTSRVQHPRRGLSLSQLFPTAQASVFALRKSRAPAMSKEVLQL
jgi:short subunit dehydrogenase-like uncharacterized protein